MLYRRCRALCDGPGPDPKPVASPSLQPGPSHSTFSLALYLTFSLTLARRLAGCVRPAVARGDIDQRGRPGRRSLPYMPQPHAAATCHSCMPWHTRLRLPPVAPQSRLTYHSLRRKRRPHLATLPLWTTPIGFYRALGYAEVGGRTAGNEVQRGRDSGGFTLAEVERCVMRKPLPPSQAVAETNPI